MKIRADFHLHSKYSRATSQEMIPKKIAEWSKIKGIDLVGSGDFTHPGWLEILTNDLEEKDEGIYRLKSGDYPEVSFVITGEISVIFSRQKNNQKQTYRQHLLVILPGLQSAKKVSARLSWEGNIKSDGRPILGLDCYQLIDLVKSIAKEAIIIPAHIWTPWFSLFGAKSGFDSLKEAYQDLVNQIDGLETGLSSDPDMNERVSQIDGFPLISSSDAHSPANIAREATVFDLKRLTYHNLRAAFKNEGADRVLYTIEFYPQEGKYHFDGHRKCQVRWSPAVSKRNNYLCPVCGRKVTVGVMSRVEELADREEAEPQREFKHLIPLTELIADIEGVGRNSKIVEKRYRQLINSFGNELDLLEGNYDQKLSYFPEIYQAILAMRRGEVEVKEGFDGQYGIIKILRKKTTHQEQMF